MSNWGQPTGHAIIEGRTCRLRILDPEAAFGLEAEIIDKLGDDLCRIAATPSVVTNACRDAITGSVSGGDAAAALERIGQLARTMLGAPHWDGPWMVRLIERVIFDRLTVDRIPICSWKEWGLVGWTPAAKWSLLGVQLEQTYGPLWSRSPYSAGGRKWDDYGVPQPTASRTVQWAAALASSGHASSVDEILRTWTPERMIDLVEIAAADAERQRRAADAARAS